MPVDEFVTGQSFVLEVRLDNPSDISVVRCVPRKALDALETQGARVLLHAPRDTRVKGYFATAVVDGFEVDPFGNGILFFLSEIRTFERCVSTMHQGMPRENAPINSTGNLAFNFYANGLRPISEQRFENILEAAGAAYTLDQIELDEAAWRVLSPGPTQPKTAEQIAVEIWQTQERRKRARLRAQLFRAGVGAFCCMSGASFNVPGGLSLLQLSHFWPLGHNGPDRLTNVGFVTGNIHPIYENGLVTVRSDYSLCFAPDIPPGFLAEFRGRSRLTMSGNVSIDPAEENLAYHRTEIFVRRLKRLGLSTAGL